MLALSLMVLAAAPASARLPLTGLVLYENGLGYFERRGSVKPGASVEIPLEPGQLDDALKSLVMMSERSVASVEYAPPLSEEAARAAAGMSTDGESARTLDSLVRSLAGVDVQVSTLKGAGFRGRVIEVAEEQEHDDKGVAFEVPTLLVFGDAGLSRVRLSNIASVRPLDPAVQLAWDRAAGSSATQAEGQSLKVRGGQAGGNVAVGYTTEAPVWRTTYRLVLGGKTPRLQGFALVHNDSDEPWAGVKVSLASGKPTSFLYPLAGPRYTRREMISPDDGLDAAPQLATAEAREHLRGSVGGVVGGVIGMSGHGVGGAGYGSGSGSLSVGGSGHVSGGTVRSVSDLLADGESQLEPAAVSEAGDLFLYTVKEPVFLGARKSALLPIVDSSAQAEGVTVIDATGHGTLGVRFSNSTGLTLEAGTVSVFTEGSYAGEAQIDRIKPGEVRVVTHGEDLDLEIKRTPIAESGPVQALRRNAAGQIELHRIERQISRLSFQSRSMKKRTVLVALAGTNYHVVSGAEEDVRSPGETRYARLTVDPKAAKDVDVVEEGGFISTQTIEQLTPQAIDKLLAEKVPADVKAQLERLKFEANRALEASSRAVAIDDSIRKIEADIVRVRANLTAAGQGGAVKVADALGEKLLKLEDQLAPLRAERETVSKRIADSHAAAVASLPLRTASQRVSMK